MTLEFVQLSENLIWFVIFPRSSFGIFLGTNFLNRCFIDASVGSDDNSPGESLNKGLHDQSKLFLFPARNEKREERV